MHSEDQIAVFSDLIAGSRSRVFGYIYAMLHNMSDAEDLYQQTTVLLWQKFGEYQPGSDFCSWAIKTAYFNIKNFQRSQARKHKFFSDAVMEKVAQSYVEIDADQSADRLDALLRCVAKLSGSSQQLLRSRYADNTPVKDLADSLGKTEAAMSMMLSRVRRSLLRCIESQLGAR